MTSPQGEPLVSVVTIVRNGRHHVERAVRSVLAQTQSGVEYLIKDGRSTDGTLELLEGYRGRLARLVSCADAGISDAWNQALPLCRGRYVALLNADDEMAPDYLERAVAALEVTGADLAYGDVELLDESSGAVRLVRGRWRPSRLWQGIGFLHPGMVARRAAYQRLGAFRTDLRFAMAADWIIRAHLAGSAFTRHEGRCRMSGGGVSNARWEEARREYLQVLAASGLPRTQQWLGRAWLLALQLKKGRSGGD